MCTRRNLHQEEKEDSEIKGMETHGVPTPEFQSGGRPRVLEGRKYHRQRRRRRRLPWIYAGRLHRGDQTVARKWPERPRFLSRNSDSWANQAPQHRQALGVRVEQRHESAAVRVYAQWEPGPAAAWSEGRASALGLAVQDRDGSRQGALLLAP